MTQFFPHYYCFDMYEITLLLLEGCVLVFMPLKWNDHQGKLFLVVPSVCWHVSTQTLTHNLPVTF